MGTHNKLSLLSFTVNIEFLAIAYRCSGNNQRLQYVFLFIISAPLRRYTLGCRYSPFLRTGRGCHCTALAQHFTGSAIWQCSQFSNRVVDELSVTWCCTYISSPGVGIQMQISSKTDRLRMFFRWRDVALIVFIVYKFAPSGLATAGKYNYSLFLSISRDSMRPLT